jgi:hypothetical protein
MLHVDLLDGESSINCATLQWYINDSSSRIDYFECDGASPFSRESAHHAIARW